MSEVDPVWLDIHDSEIAATVRARHGATGYRVLAVASILWTGWECDHTAAVVALDDGRRDLVVIGATAVGGPVDLRERLAAYHQATEATLELLRLLEEPRDGGDSS